MDLTSPLKPDVFRVVMVILLPGLLTIFPWLAWFFWPELLQVEYWKDGGGLVAGLFVLGIALMAGMVVEDVGAHLEVHVIDPYVCKKKEVDHDTFEKQWMAYLMTSCTDRVVAHRYLRSMVTRFKFELSMLPACCSVGLALVLAWLTGVGFDTQRTAGFLLADGALIYFLFDQARLGGRQLHELRLSLCEGETKNAAAPLRAAEAAPVHLVQPSELSPPCSTSVVK